jgi:uncharacterized protein YycO
MLQHSVQVINHYRKGRFVAAFFVTLCVVLCACNSPREKVVYETDEWRNGDLVLRCGYGMESRMVVERSRSTYSHIGMLYRDSAKDEWLVIHAVPGEDDPEYVKAEPITLFYSSERAKNGAWLRIDCSDNIAQKAVQYALKKVTEHCLFDNDYLLADSSQFYCTELVWRAYNQQGIDITSGKRHEVPSFFCKERACIFPNDIEQSETTLFVKPLKTKVL